MGKWGRHWKTGRHYGENEGDIGKQESTMGEPGRHWKTGRHYGENEGDIGKQESTMRKRGRQWKIGRHYGENEGDIGKQEGTMGKRGTKETLEKRTTLWENEGGIRKQEGTMGKRGRHWKTGRHYGKRGRLWKTGRHYGETREALENRKILWGNEGGIGKQESTMGKRGRHWKKGRHYGETREALENRKALRSPAGRRFIITTDRFNFHPLYTMSRPFFLLVSVAVRHKQVYFVHPYKSHKYWIDHKRKRMAAATERKKKKEKNHTACEWQISYCSVQRLLLASFYPRRNSRTNMTPKARRCRPERDVLGHLVISLFLLPYQKAVLHVSGIQWQTAMGLAEA